MRENIIFNITMFIHLLDTTGRFLTYLKNTYLGYLDNESTISI